MTKNNYQIIFFIIVGVLVLVTTFKVYRSSRRLRKLMEPDPAQWRPVVADPNAEKLSEQYGIAPARAEELLSQMNELGRHRLGKTTPLHEIVGSVASLCRTKEEFAWASFIHAVYLINNGITFT